MGYAERKKENYKVAIEHYTKALELNTKYFKVYYLRWLYIGSIQSRICAW